MKRIAIYIELKDGQIKHSNFGVIPVAAKSPEAEIYAIVLGGKAEEHLAIFQKYGVHKIVHIPTAKIQKPAHPELYAALVMEVMRNFGINILLGLTTLHGKADRQVTTKEVVSPPPTLQRTAS